VNLCLCMSVRLCEPVCLWSLGMCVCVCVGWVVSAAQAPEDEPPPPVK
jgi:hypothetical protein